MANKPEPVPDAAEPDLSNFSGLMLGPPFAIAGDCELLDRDAATACQSCEQPQVHGAVAIVRCACGQPFRINLLSDGNKPCPAKGCGRVYTHVLLVADIHDDEIFADACMGILKANGYEVEPPGDDEDPDDDGDPDDDEPPDDDDTELDDDEAPK